MFYDEPPKFLASTRFDPVQKVDPKTVVISYRKKILDHDLLITYRVKSDTFHVKRSDLKDLCEKVGTTLEATVPKLNSNIILE